MNSSSTQSFMPLPKGALPGSITERIMSRDPQAMNELLMLYRPLLRSLAERQLERRLHRRVDGSDVVQEVCFSVAQARNETRAINRLQFWRYLRTILTNKLNDVRRKVVLAGKRSIDNEVALTNATDLEKWLTAAEQQPLEALLHDEKCQRLLAVVSRLPRELQRLLWWRFRKDLSYREIGKRMDRSEERARTLVIRCLDRVREELNSESEN